MGMRRSTTTTADREGRARTRTSLLVSAAWLVIASVPALITLAPIDTEPEPWIAASPPAALSLDEAELARTWRYASGVAGRERIADAIDEATEEIEIGRQTTRRRLRDKLEPAALIILDIDIDIGEVDLTLGDTAVRDVPLGVWVDWRHEGRDYELRFRQPQAGTLIQEVRSPHEAIERRFELDQDELLVHVRLADERLPDDVRYWLAYAETSA